MNKYSERVSHEMVLLPTGHEYISNAYVYVDSIRHRARSHVVYFLNSKLHLWYRGTVTESITDTQYTVYQIKGYSNSIEGYAAPEAGAYYVVGKGLGVRFEGLIDPADVDALVDPTFTIHVLEKATRSRISDTQPLKPGVSNLPGTAWSVHGSIDVTRIPAAYRLVYMRLTKEQREGAYRELAASVGGGLGESPEAVAATVGRCKPALEQFKWGRGMEQTPAAYPTAYPTYGLRVKDGVPTLRFYLEGHHTPMDLFTFLVSGYRELLPRHTPTHTPRSWFTAFKKVLSIK